MSLKIKNSHILTMCILAIAFYCYEYYLRVMPSVMGTELIKAYGISHAGLGILSACFYYAYTPIQIPVGLLVDKYGPRLMLTLACAICVIGNHCFGNASSLLLAQIGRFLIGLGSAFAFVGFLKIAATWLPQKYYAMMVGLCMLLGTLGAMVGEIIIAYFMRNTVWTQILNISTIIGIFLTSLLWICIKDTKQTENKDIQKDIQKTKNINSNLLITLKNSILSGKFWVVGLIGCLTYLPLSIFAEMWAVPYLESLHYTKNDAAIGSSLIFLGFGLGGPLWGILSDAVKSRRIPIAIGSFTAGIFILLPIIMPDIPKYLMFISLFFCGFCTSVEILVFAIGNDLTNKDTSGTVIAIINMIVMIGGVILQPIIGKILDIYYIYDNPYKFALIILPIGLLIAGILSLFLKESYKIAS